MPIFFFSHRLHLLFAPQRAILRIDPTTSSEAPTHTAGMQLATEHAPSSMLSQTITLLRRKEILLKLRRPWTTVCEIALPAILCSFLIIGVSLSTLSRESPRDFAPRTASGTVQTIGPQIMWPLMLAGQASAGLDFGTDLLNGALSRPAAIPPFGLWLFYASVLSNRNLTSLVVQSDLLGPLLGLPAGSAAALGAITAAIPQIPPFDGASRKGLAITPDTPSIRALVNALVNGTGLKQAAREWVDLLDVRLSTAFGAGGALTAFKEQLEPLLIDFMLPEYSVAYYASEKDIEDAAHDGRVWAGLVFTSVPERDAASGAFGHGRWAYSLRFNTTLVPNTRQLWDQFAVGLSSAYYGYYGSGFLSLQASLNGLIRAQYSDSSGLDVVGVPYPTAAYEQNLFFEFAGNLIGLVVVFSLLIPLSTMLRALVLERESKLREQLLIMGTSLPAYYGAFIVTYGTTFVIAGTIGARRAPTRVETARARRAFRNTLCVSALTRCMVRGRRARDRDPDVHPLRLLARARPLPALCPRRARLHPRARALLPQRARGGARGPAAVLHLVAAVHLLPREGAPLARPGRQQDARVPPAGHGLLPGCLEHGAREATPYADTLSSIGPPPSCCPLSVHAHRTTCHTPSVSHPTMQPHTLPTRCIPPLAACAQYEGSQQGITWGTMGEGEFSFATSLTMLLVDIVGYLFLGWYLDQVIPSEYGVQRKPWFLCTPSYWRGCGTRGSAAAAGATPASSEADVVEPLAKPIGERGVSARGLRKVWSRGVAVHGLDLDMCAGEITCLLGANGAGKTTTISMLTGLIPPTAGEAVIDGKPIGAHRSHASPQAPQLHLTCINVHTRLSVSACHCVRRERDGGDSRVAGRLPPNERHLRAVDAHAALAAVRCTQGAQRRAARGGRQGDAAECAAGGAGEHVLARAIGRPEAQA